MRSTGPRPSERRTKIVATIGPASDSPEMLRLLINAGMNMARIGLAHGSIEQTIEKVRRIRAAADEAGRFIGVLADLPGPKIRAGAFEDDGVHLVENMAVELVEDTGTSHAGRITIDYPGLLLGIEPGDVIGIGDGAVTVVVEGVGGGGAQARVRSGGEVRGRPGVNLPPERFNAPSPTDEDLRLLAALLDEGVDAVAVSFVQRAADIARVREFVGPEGPLLVAKIETAAAVDDLSAIVRTADAVMVARGDLGVRLPIEDVPHIQKRIIRETVSWGRPVITATQMLESMIHSPVPTRAEVSDVANAVMDGTSALMLSAETAIGSHAVAAVAAMSRIAARAEAEFNYYGWGHDLGLLQSVTTEAPDTVRMSAAISAAAWRAAHDADADAIICATRSGATAKAISRFRPVAPLLAVTPNPATARQLSVAWGVDVVLDTPRTTIDEIVWFAVKAAVEHGVCKAGDVVVVLAGAPDDPEPITDVLRLVRVR